MKQKSRQRESVLPLLENGPMLSREQAASVHQQTGVPEAEIWGAGSFYSLLQTPVGTTGVCQGLSCKLKGADAWADTLQAERGSVTRVSCLGQCDLAPVALFKRGGHDYQIENKAAHAPQQHLDNPNLPMNLGGDDDKSWSALRRATEQGVEWVLSELASSGLQGRGGAGFPAAVKWNLVRNETETERYVVCNADEGEPGTFKDRDILLHRPHLLLEGLAIAALCVNANTIIVYIRGEFVEEKLALEKAIAECQSHIGNISIQVACGHGAYICGEETALLEALEGNRGMPRLKPPYPTHAGFRGKPTLMNNVETVACVPAIVLQGGSWFKSQGRSEAGTKLYCISGHVNQPGVYELPLGVTLNELAEAAGGFEGTPKAFSPGGASSGFLPMSRADTPLDFGNLKQVGSMLGSAGVVVLNDTVNLAEMAYTQSIFFEDESCGQCAPCRIGTQVIRAAMKKTIEQGDTSGLRHLEDISWEMEEGSICGLGMVAAQPVQNALQYFPEDFPVLPTDPRG